MIDFVTAFASIPAVLALVNLLKKFGVTGKWSALAAIVIGIGLNAAQWAWADYAWFTSIASGLIYGLAAAGLYDLKPEPVAVIEPERVEISRDVVLDMPEIETD